MLSGGSMLTKSVHQHLFLLLKLSFIAPIVLLLSSLMVVKTTEAETTRIVGSVGTWGLVSSPVTDDLKSIAMTSASNGWAVGNGGTILHWNGNLWSKANSPTTQPLYAVKMISANNGWAVGGFGTILHWDGSSWNLVDSPIHPDLFSVDFLSPNEGWSVGWVPGGGSERYGAILKWNGSAWSMSQTNMKDIGYRTVVALATDNVWVVGRYQEILSPTNPYPIIKLDTMHWDGSQWNEKLVDHCDNWINSMAVTSATTGWAVGTYGCILPFNGGWDNNSISGISSNYILVSINIVAADDVWVVGGDNLNQSLSKSLILHWNGSTWDVTPNPGNRILSGVSMSSANDG
jgi:hypothetical protein